MTERDTRSVRQVIGYEGLHLHPGTKRLLLPILVALPFVYFGVDPGKHYPWWALPLMSPGDVLGSIAAKNEQAFGLSIARYVFTTVFCNLIIFVGLAFGVLTISTAFRKSRS